MSKNLVESAGSADAASAGLVDAWGAQSFGAPIIVIADNPTLEEDPNKCLRFSSPADCDVSRKTSLTSPDPLVSAARTFPTATLVDFTNLFCGERTCPVVIGGADVYRDQDHLTATFANTLGAFIGKATSLHLGAAGQSK